MHKAKLAAALEIHAFNRDIDDINDRINEKAVAVSTDDLGKDLAGVQALQRKQEEVERDMTALQAQLEVQLLFACYFCIIIFSSKVKERLFIKLQNKTFEFYI